MRKALSIFFLMLSLLAFKNTAYAVKVTWAEKEIDDCMYLWNAGDYKGAIEAGKLAVKKYPKNLDAYICLAGAYEDAEELRLALETMKKAASITNNKKDLINIYIETASILRKMGNLDDALLYYNKGLSLAKGTKDKRMQINILWLIAKTYEDKGELDEALSYYEKSLSLETDKSFKTGTYDDIGSVYEKKGDYQKAVEYIKKAIELNEHPIHFSWYRLHLGDVYRKMKDYKNAEKYLFEALENYKKWGANSGIAEAYRYFGRLYRDKGDYKTARDYYTRAYNLFKSSGAERGAQDVLDEIKELDKSN
jgi:tetratricopeptide (TPR) repeat protein